MLKSILGTTFKHVSRKTKRKKCGSDYRNRQQKFVRCATLISMASTRDAGINFRSYFQARFPKNKKSAAISEFAIRESLVVSAVLWFHFGVIEVPYGSPSCPKGGNRICLFSPVGPPMHQDASRRRQNDSQSVQNNPHNAPRGSK